MTASSNSFQRLIDHEIRIQPSLQGPHCGLILSAPSAKTTTTGLQWDLSDTEMRFGGLISTSNMVKGENHSRVGFRSLVDDIHQETRLHETLGVAWDAVLRDDFNGLVIVTG
ncbi:hypothetical protein Bca52824_062052 [Brassica carinata]|uniref:Thiamin pyrophosphokinase thiamin-binding domain-containing protein n=1 Tax=Brassica carinata TaxID=52824 RepID=A0A8X7U6C4_BRACI|nr:hypothetical protein Bca52824_062052 [Brassica carinata]